MSDTFPAAWLEAARQAQQNLPPLPKDEGNVEAGSLLVMANLPEGTAELASGIEWALIEQDPAAKERYLAVPVDGLSLLGSRDLEVGHEGERRVLRCAYPLWLQQEPPIRWQKTGRLSPTELARARRHLQKLAQGEKVGSVLAQDLDSSADYQEEIAQPLEALVRQLRQASSRPAIQDQPPTRRPANSSTNQAMRIWAIAASILVALLSVTFTRKVQQLETIRLQQEARVEQAKQQVQELESSRQRLMAETQRLTDQNSAALEQAASSEASLQQTRERLEQARKESVIANPELAILSRPGSTRGEVKVELERGASHLLVLIPLDDLPRTQKYRLELIGGKEPWTSPELEVLSPGELRVGIPASLLPEGDVILRLRASKDGKKLADYELVIDRKAKR